MALVGGGIEGARAFVVVVEVLGRGGCGEGERRRGVEEDDIEREEAGGIGFWGLLSMAVASRLTARNQSGAAAAGDG